MEREGSKVTPRRLDGATYLETGTVRRSLWLEGSELIFRHADFEGAGSIQVKMSNRKPGVCTEVSLFFRSGRAFSISFNVFKRSRSSDHNVSVLTHLTKEGLCPAEMALSWGLGF